MNTTLEERVICEHEVRGESISVIAMLGGNMYL